MVEIMKFMVLAFSLITFNNGLQLPFWNLNLDIPMPSLPKGPFNLPSMIGSVFGPEEMESETNGLFSQMDNDDQPTFNGKDVKTKKETTEKDGYEITTVNKTGPGFFSIVSEMHSKGNGTNGTLMDIGKAMMDTGLQFGQFSNGFRNDNKVKLKCKDKCSSTEYCNPFSGKCRSLLPMGESCMMFNQCEKGLRCVWGKCQMAKKGDPGTFCKTKDQCTGEACCTKKDNSFYAVCIPALEEGAICGQKSNSLFMDMLAPEQKPSDTKCNPCKSDLKCGEVGDSEDMRCVKTSFLEHAIITKKKLKSKIKGKKMKARKTKAKKTKAVLANAGINDKDFNDEGSTDDGSNDAESND